MVFMESETQYETATLGGGCFWCLEAVYDRVEGVREVVSGYAGGHIPQPSYQAVCGGATGHAEVTQLRFDPAAISFQALLEIFFTIHDPTTLNRQGADVGTQYRSVIFYHSPEQKETAEQLIAQLTADKIWPNPIVTELSPIPEFYPAEDYHQDYFANNPHQPYCQAVVAPKVVKLRQKYAHRLKREK
jgi:peptide-methionine (S)-S-oxide reductase